MPEHHAQTPPIRTALITGAGSGIGRALAVRLATEHFGLILLGRDEQSLKETAALLGTGAKTHILCADVGEPSRAKQIIAEAIGTFGSLDVLVNNAGYAPLLPIHASTPEALQAIYNVNALGPAALIAAIWPHFVDRRGGTIVCTSTLGTRDPFPGFFGYAAAKSAIDSMVRSCAIEGRAHGIRAFSVAPGAVETPMLRANFSTDRIPTSATMSPEFVAEVMAECILGQRDDRNGQTIYLSAERGIE